MKNLLLLACSWFIGIAYVSAQEKTELRRQEFLSNLTREARARILVNVLYDPAYVSIPYPNGDVPADRGVCTDEVVRVYRKLGIDLQKEVHEDMKRHFRLYPKTWGLSRPDPNIDHRRVPNLRVFFARKGIELPITDRGSDYAAGELVTWDLGGGIPHIGMVVTDKTPDGGRHLIVHNIGAGPRLEDILFSYKITGHYRYFGPEL